MKNLTDLIYIDENSSNRKKEKSYLVDFSLRDVEREPRLDKERSNFDRSYASTRKLNEFEREFWFWYFLEKSKWDIVPNMTIKGLI